MTEPEETDKPVVQTRTPKKKVTTGIFDNLRKLPAPHPVEEILGLTQPDTGSTPSTGTTGTTGTTPSTTTRPSTLPAQIKSPIAPERNYTKVPNSIVKQGIPAGIFGEQGGKAKELYDTLYSLTRGAVVPRRKIRIPKDQLMKKSGIGSEVTLRKNLVRLRSVKLIKETIVPGTHGGNEYEVFLLEEVGLTGSTPSIPSTSSTPSSNSTGSSSPQMQEPVEAVESTDSIASISLDEATSSSEDKTLSLRPPRTIDDDAALAGLIATIKTTSKEITGKELSVSESDRWKELAEVLMAELKIAAARTTISSVPAFMAEHLRRRLWKIDKKQARAEGRELPDEVVTLTPSVDASKCPDCGGSGWWYPEGEAKGVAKCKHGKLATEN
jgi:hypothetical protein